MVNHSDSSPLFILCPKSLIRFSSPRPGSVCCAMVERVARSVLI